MVFGFFKKKKKEVSEEKLSAVIEELLKVESEQGDILPEESTLVVPDDITNENVELKEELIEKIDEVIISDEIISEEVVNQPIDETENTIVELISPSEINKETIVEHVEPEES
ncbi:MAG: hypothetical protein PHC75_07180, partial [Burkholderiales bacterium]|nr:hypothetical protein [Burkholderiales bacterium]